MGAPNFLLLAVTISLMLTAVNGLSRSEYNDIKGKLLDMMKNKRRENGYFLAANILRAAFHEVGTWSVTQQNGGASGLIFKNCDSSGPSSARLCERANKDNNGLDVARIHLLKLWKSHDIWKKISLADLLQLAAITAIESAGGPKADSFNFKWGRIDKTVDESKSERLPKAHINLRSVLATFSSLGLDWKDVLILMGAHTIGECHKGASGHNGPWTFTPYTWNNAYYLSLSSSNWVKGNGEWTRHLLLGGKMRKTLMLQADFAFWEEGQVNTVHELIHQYATDEALWNRDFIRVWTKLVERATTDKLMALGEGTYTIVSRPEDNM